MKFIFGMGLTDTNVADKEGVGTLRYERERVYRWVQNAESATDLSAGDLCTHVVSGGVTMTQSVKKPVTANLGFIAGIVMAATLKFGYYGWIQIHGPGSANISGGTTGGTDIAAGDYIKGVNSQTYGARDGATSPTYARNLQALVAVGTTTTPAAALKAAFIRCLQ